MLHAVSIGINDYKDPDIRDLNFARNDAEAFADGLERSIDERDCEVTRLCDSEATLEAIQLAIGEELPRRATSPDDIVAVYFAGHGSCESDAPPDGAARYLAAHDTRFDRVYATAIDLEHDIKAWFRRMREPKLIVFFIDACFSGQAGGRSFRGPSIRNVRGGTRSPIRMKSLELGEGRVVITACDDNESAIETNALEHGIFTHSLLATLTEKNGSEHTIGLSQLYESVQERVSRQTSKYQSPVLNGRITAARFPRFQAPE